MCPITATRWPRFLLSAALFGLFPLLLRAEPDAPIRTGLWVMQRLPESPADTTKMVGELRKNPHIKGICLHIAWKQIETKMDQPDFAAIDRAVAGLRGIGKQYQLCFKPGVQTPDFVYSEGAKAFTTRVTNPQRANVGEVVRIPVPWDPVFEQNFARIIKRLGDRYAADPACVSVVITCANFMSAEMHLPKRRTDLNEWQSLGDYEAKLLLVYKTFIDRWGEAFPRQELSLHLSKVLDLPPSFQERIIEYGLSKYPDRFSIQNCQLSGRKEDIGVMSYDLVQKYRDRAHHGFQSLAALSPPNDRMGSVEMAALNLVHARGEYWELWHGDGFSLETASIVTKVWREARQMGYDAYKKKLISEGKYRQRR